MQAFIDFANFYKRFVHAFFKVNAELFSLLKKDDKSKFKIKFIMISETKEFMKSIKRIFMNASMLRHYELDDELSREMTIHNTEDCESRVLMIERSQK